MSLSPASAVASTAGPVHALVAADARRLPAAVARLAGDGRVVATRASDDGQIDAVAVPESLIVLLLCGPVGDRVRTVRAWADANPDARLVATIEADAPAYAMRRMLRAGAHGIVLDGELDRALLPAVVAVTAGLMAAPGALRRHVAPRPLSHRERQALELVVRGYTNRQIAQTLWVAESTVKTHLSSAFAKLEAHSRAEAVARILDGEEGYGLGVLAPGDGVETGAGSAPTAAA